VKGKFRLIVGVIESVVGFVMWIAAQMTIAANSSYTWRKPYTDFETQTILIRTIGIVLLIWGLIDLALLFYRTRYLNKHVKPADKLTDKGGVVKCAACGLTLAANVTACPRCGAVRPNAPIQTKTESEEAK